MSAPHVGPAWISEVNEVSMVLSIISITLSCIAILSFIIFPERRRFPVRLPMYICISALGLALFSLFSSESMCRAQALGIYYFGTSTWVWWSIISFNFYDIIIRGKMGAAQKRERLYNLIGWIVPAAFLAVAIAVSALEEERQLGIWECFLSQENSTTQYLLFYGWLGVVCIAALFIWPRCLYEVCVVHFRQSGSTTKSLRVTALSRHMLFMLVFFFEFVVLVTLHIYKQRQGVTEGNAMLHTITVASVGIFTFLIFALTKQNVVLWFDLCRTCSNKPKGPGNGSINGEDQNYMEMAIEGDDDPEALGLRHSGHVGGDEFSRSAERDILSTPMNYNLAGTNANNHGGGSSWRSQLAMLTSSSSGALPNLATTSSGYIPPQVPGVVDGLNGGMVGTVPMAQGGGIVYPPGPGLATDITSPSVGRSISSIRGSYLMNDDDDDGGLYSAIGESPANFDARGQLWRPNPNL